MNESVADFSSGRPSVGAGPAKTFSQVRTRAAGVTSMVNAFRGLEDETGAVVRELTRAENLLRTMIQPVLDLSTALGQDAIGAAFAADVNAWIDAGLGERPCFDRTQAAFTPPRDGETTFLVAPLRATDGPEPHGFFLECFLAMRDEPATVAAAAARFPHPRSACQAGRLIMGSDGIQKGNCMFFSPEDIATREGSERPPSRFFFFDEFQAIYERETMPRVRRVFGDKDAFFGTSKWVSSAMDPAECYGARAVWAYLHDYFRHWGPRPIDSNQRVKDDFFTCLLQDLKCDCQAAIVAATDDLACRRELFELVVFDRIFRYPGQPDALRSRDAASGVLLFEWLAREGAIWQLAGNRLSIDIRATVTAMLRLVERIEQLERIKSDSGYKSASEVFVRTLLPGGKIGDRFSYPDAYARMAQVKPGERGLDPGQPTL